VCKTTRNVASFGSFGANARVHIRLNTSTDRTGIGARRNHIHTTQQFIRVARSLGLRDKSVRMLALKTGASLFYVSVDSYGKLHVVRKK